jgi:hypothetical protein
LIKQQTHHNNCTKYTRQISPDKITYSKHFNTPLRTIQMKYPYVHSAAAPP